MNLINNIFLSTHSSPRSSARLGKCTDAAANIKQCVLTTSFDFGWFSEVPTDKQASKSILLKAQTQGAKSKALLYTFTMHGKSWTITFTCVVTEQLSLLSSHHVFLVISAWYEYKIWLNVHLNGAKNTTLVFREIFFFFSEILSVKFVYFTHNPVTHLAVTS